MSGEVLHPLRPYQLRLVSDAVSANTLVMLPTGSGKTLIAAETARHVGGRTLFLVPTVMLVAQQAAAIREFNLGRVAVGEYHGNLALPAADVAVLVTTPKAFQMAQLRGEPGLAWTEFSLVVFDEVHHVLKDHPYRKLAASLRNAPTLPRILGLSASLTYAVTPVAVEAAVKRLIDELRIDIMGTAEAEELREGGYHGGAEATQPEIVLPLGAEIDGVVPQAERKPHLMKSIFLSRIAAGSAAPFARQLAVCVDAMEQAVALECSNFSSPLQRLAMTEWGVYAHKLAAGRNISDLASVQLTQLEQWYEAMKLLCVGWEETEDAATTLLRMMGTDTVDAIAAWPPAAAAVLSEFWGTVAQASFPRFQNLLKVLAEKLDAIPRSTGSDFREIVFVQQRVMTHMLAHVIARDANLRNRLNTACLYATSSPATPSLAINRTEAARRLSRFAAGDSNLLIATVVAEEGMDIPAANCVIRFDDVQHALSYCQGRGRARQADSAFVLLAERADRPAVMLAQVEQQQLDIVRTIQPQTRDRMTDEQARTAQKNRERGALKGLQLAGPINTTTGLAVLNVFCSKAKVSLVETFNDGRAELTYESCLRRVSACLPPAVQENCPEGGGREIGARVER